MAASMQHAPSMTAACRGCAGDMLPSHAPDFVPPLTVSHLAYCPSSHAVFIVTVSVREVTPEGDEVIRVGKLYLVDLAGSENITR